MLFGAIADDYTGGSDLAGMLAGHGVRTVQVLGVPADEFIEEIEGRYDAAIVCLKSRSIPAAVACELSVSAIESLYPLGPEQIQFKYCSTFDSTSQGNIGPVADALLRNLGTPSTVAVPALPVNGRTQYQGYLFVNGVLLSESPLRDHPLNPMTESNLVRHLQAQTSRRVGLIPLAAVRGGSLMTEMARTEDSGVEIALVDAIEDSDLDQIAEAIVNAKLITGGSGIAEKLPAIWKRRGRPTRRPPIVPRPKRPKGTLILSGSCSAATLHQLAAFGTDGIQMNGRRPPDEEAERLAAAVARAMEICNAVLVYSSASAEERRQTQTDPANIERTFAALARRVVSGGQIGNLIVAGGETSGAVTDALGITAFEVLDILDPGVPALFTLSDRPLAVALKSGNFGSPDFFSKATRYLEAL